MGLVPKGLLSLHGILGGGKSQPIPGTSAVKVACSARARTAQMWRRYSPKETMQRMYFDFDGDVEYLMSK